MVSLYLNSSINYSHRRWRPDPGFIDSYLVEFMVYFYKYYTVFHTTKLGIPRTVALQSIRSVELIASYGYPYEAWLRLTDSRHGDSENTTTRRLLCLCA